jgi:hypothetical protein
MGDELRVVLPTNDEQHEVEVGPDLSNHQMSFCFRAHTMHNKLSLYFSFSGRCNFRRSQFVLFPVGGFIFSHLLFYIINIIQNKAKKSRFLSPPPHNHGHENQIVEECGD